jgi:IS5 family transposase
VDATIIAAPSSTKNAEGLRDPEMHQTRKGNQWHFGMKAHIAVDADSGLVHTVTATAANEADVEQVADLLHGKEEQVYADSGYRGSQSRVHRDDLQWHIAARPSDIAKMPEGKAKTTLQKEEHRKASVRAKVEHPFRVIKRQFGLVKVRFRGLQKNTAHVLTLFALSNLWMARHRLIAIMGAVRPNAA